MENDTHKFWTTFDALGLMTVMAAADIERAKPLSPVVVDEARVEAVASKLFSLLEAE